MGFVFSGTQLGKHWFHTFFFLKRHLKVCGKLRESRMLCLPKEARDGSFPQHKARLTSILRLSEEP